MESFSKKIYRHDAEYEFNESINNIIAKTLDFT